MDELIKRLVKKYNTSSPFELAEALGIHIRFMHLGDGTKGLYYRKLRRRFIVIHNQLPLEWQRFVCAHELAHDRLHKGVNRFFWRRILISHQASWNGRLTYSRSSCYRSALPLSRMNRYRAIMQELASRLRLSFFRRLKERMFL